MAGEVTAQTYGWGKELLLASLKCSLAREGNLCPQPQRPGMSACARSLRPASHTAGACVGRSKGRKGKVQTFLQSWLWAESAVKIWCIQIIALVLTLSLWRSMTFSLYFRNQACKSFKLGTHNHLTDNRGGRAHSLAPKYILWINSLCCLSAESRTWWG